MSTSRWSRPRSVERADSSRRRHGCRARTLSLASAAPHRGQTRSRLSVRGTLCSQPHARPASRRRAPPAGATVWLTGLPSAGKTTVAKAVAEHWPARGRRGRSCSTATRSAPTSPATSASAGRTAPPRSPGSAGSPGCSPVTASSCSRRSSRRTPPTVTLLRAAHERRPACRSSRFTSPHAGRGLRRTRRQGPLRQAGSRRDDRADRRRRRL